MAAIVQTSAGPVRGAPVSSAAGSVLAFRGIPYAAPPIGERRFAVPEAPEPWRPVRDALAFAPAPPQSSGALLELLGTAPGIEQDEDCLGINVYTPAVAGAHRPVLVWLHGGAFISGQGSAAVYDGSLLAARGDVVVVTMNYRVGALGYLYLDGSESASGPRCSNIGLRDQIAALGWVRENAAAFGGDARNVTLFGESAGAGSICALMAAPAALGLFHRAIVQSAAPDGFLSPDEARERTARLLEVLGVSSNTLRDLPARALVDAQGRCAGERVWKTGMFFAPVVDGDVLPERPMQAMRDGSAARVPLLIGTLRDELQLYKFGAAPMDLPDDAVMGVIAGMVTGTAADGRPRAETVLECYRRVRTGRGESTCGIDLVYAIQTDLAMRVPAIRAAEHQCRHQPDTYMYLFDWCSPVQNGELGACHALDVPFTFGTLDAPGMAALAGEGDVPRRISDQMIEAWLAFAREGRPCAASLGDWPAYDPGRRSTMILGEHPGMVKAPREEERSALAEVVAELVP